MMASRFTGASSDTYYSREGNFGMGVAITMNTFVSERLVVKHEMGYWKKGGTIAAGVVGSENTTQTLKYLEVLPFVPAYYHKGLQIYCGPYTSVLSSASYMTRDENGNPKRQSNRYNFRSADVGGIVGLEYEFGMGLNIGIRASQGFFNIAHPQREHIRMQALTFTLGYSFSQRQN